MRYVIIGNSVAAVGCIEGIRSTDQESEITVVSNESYHVYSRPLISYLLYGKTDFERMKYRPDSFYKDNRVTLLTNKTVTAIDPSKKEIALASGETIPYDKLLVGTGSRPFVPPMAGLDTVKNKFSFMTLDDALGLASAITPSSRVLIVGAGLIGLKCAEGVREKVKSITVVDLADKILASILNDQGGLLIKEYLEKKGIRFYLGNSVAEFKENTALLKNGETVDFDVCVLAVGVRPNTELVKEIGGEVNRGIIVNAKCETSLADIYAAGDCSEGFDSSIGANRVLALFPNAYMQGFCAGVNMAGGNTEFTDAIPMNAIGFFGYHIITAGSYEGDLHEIADGDNYKALYVKDGLLRGYIMIGDTARAGIYTRLIREKTPLDTINFELLLTKPQLAALSQSDRKAILNKTN